MLHVPDSLVLGSLELDPALQMCLASAEQRQDHLLPAAASTPPHAARDTTGLCCKGTLVAHVQLVHQDPMSFSTDR